MQNGPIEAKLDPCAPSIDGTARTARPPIAYAMGELRAELSSAFLAGELGIPADIPQHASYIADRLKALKQDNREIFRAAADAQKIVDMVLGFHPDWAAVPMRPDGKVMEEPAREPIIV